MAANEDLGHLELLVALCHQLTDAEADRLLELDVDDDPMFVPAVLAAHDAGRVRLSAAQVEVLRRDLVPQRIAV